jgi:hypothetical protein
MKAKKDAKKKKILILAANFPDKRLQSVVMGWQIFVKPVRDKTTDGVDHVGHRRK